VKPFRIFLASPGDVVEERKLAGEVFAQLRHERAFRDDLNLQNFAWDQPGNNIAMPMGITPQQAISQGLMQPCDCDLVVIILWSRMGTPLPPEYAKPDGSPYLSGTEWEYWNAMEAFQKHRRPRIWMYRRTEDPLVHVGDPDLHQKREQWERLQQFLGMIRNSDGSIAHGLNDYQTVAGFQRQLEQHLRDELIRFLRESAREQVLAATRETAAANTEPPAPVPTEHARESTIARQSLEPVANQEKKPESGSSAKGPEPRDLPYTDLGETGKDEFGHWLRLDYRGVEQRFRWIPPGRFWMGSPETEPDHRDNETQHEVELRRGFWLGGTAVTQALWTAVMSKNPSNFQGQGRPVERVSWDDVQKFLQRLRVEYPEILFDLPTEAEWEYACRAGTRTPFSFGWNITPAQVNYDGNYPYDGAEKGEFREQTVPVKSLPPNPWGLFEMHGNVWEWCADRFRDFNGVGTGEVVTDPKGPMASSSRVLRGGSWLDLARDARSAARLANERDLRNHDFGFRLVLRSSVQRGPEGR